MRMLARVLLDATVSTVSQPKPEALPRPPYRSEREKHNNVSHDEVLGSWKRSARASNRRRNSLRSCWGRGFLNADNLRSPRRTPP